MVLFSGKGMKMKVQKYEIARVIDKLKSIVQKNDQFPALGGILVIATTDIGYIQEQY